MNREQNDINADNCCTVNSFRFTHNSSQSTVHSLAFTLAETLIVMGIIGVVAALTIPNVNKNTGRAEAVAKVKKIYAELSEAHDRATAVYGPINTWPSNCDAKCYRDRILEFIKFQKICNGEAASHNEPRSNGCADACLYYVTKELDECGYPEYQYYSALLNNGMSINIEHFGNREVSDGRHGFIEVNIDRAKGSKQISGINYFYFDITNNGIKPGNNGNEWTDDSLKSCFTYGEFCTEWVIRNGNMDYLDASHEESTAGKCKNGKQLSTTVSSCK